jgi:hypothetical protein
MACLQGNANRGNLRPWLKSIFATSATCQKTDALVTNIAVPAREGLISGYAKMASITANPAGRRAICKRNIEESGDRVIWRIGRLVARLPALNFMATVLLQICYWP